MQQQVSRRAGRDLAAGIVNAKLDLAPTAGVETQPLRRDRYVQIHVLAAADGRYLHVSESGFVEGAELDVAADRHRRRPGAPVPTPGVLGLSHEDAPTVASLRPAAIRFRCDLAAQGVRLLVTDVLETVRQPHQQHVVAFDEVPADARHERPECRRMIAQVCSIEKDRRAGVQAVEFQFDDLGRQHCPGRLEDLAKPPGAALDPMSVKAVEPDQGLGHAPRGNKALADISGHRRRDPPVGQPSHTRRLGGPA